MNTNKYLKLRVNARKWNHEEGGIIKAADGNSLFINTGRVVSKNDQLTDEKYKQFAEEISKSTDIPELEFETSEDEKKESVVVKKEDDQPWTTAYRAGGNETTTISPTSTTSTRKPDMSKPRSDRNNNPLNIRFTNIGWQGKITDGKTDNEFEEFESRDLGWRAAYRNIQTKMNKGLNTISKLVSEWAPPSENNTNGYVLYVSSKTGIDPDAIITQEDLPKIGAAMAAVESGRRNNIDWDDALRGYKFYTSRV